MKQICLFFQIHQPFRHRRYRFFDIGNDHYYYDDYSNESIVHNITKNCYLPANKLLLELAEKYKNKFKVAFSITGVALEQFELYAPEVIESFQKLAKTGCVEFLAETYSHSLSSLKDADTFTDQVKRHDKQLVRLFGQKPKVFRNTEMIYSDEIGERVAKMGYSAMLTEGAKHILGWKSPNFLYVNAINPRLKILMRNYKMSDDIAFRFSDKKWDKYPLTAEKFVEWLEDAADEEEIVNLFLGYDTFGSRQPKESGIFEFLKAVSEQIVESNCLKFSTPSEAAEELQPVSAVSVPHPISWSDEERDLSAWLGNGMQMEAYGKLYDMRGQMAKCTDPELQKDWNYLQVSDHFFYMSTKYFADADPHSVYSNFDSPYEAFINYMNVLSDFKMRLNAKVPENEIENEIASLHRLLEEKEQKIKKMEDDLRRLQKNKKLKK
ncbi:glycoside hydrolase family 57 protein [Draconibacterium sp. IB214405]|uniref:glycoside hydrolase family 57 protein n=1 Tax=Draconibacterium sp. IB214405 TaxID=3097352 RepID=UPI002A142F5D|nr:glycoside hydrolase family 57 protein [Draconibacterium sp. IB214405]MDX8337593.1 glycoside hydrolase family 57 protein [Draconibacterium sp. IB214405]